MAYEYIRTEQAGRVRRLILNRPQARNAQSRRLTEELDDAFQAAEDDLGTGVVVLMGEGDHFSAGHDLGTPQEMADREARPQQGGLRGRYGRSYDLNIEANLRWRNLRKPTIAAVQGYCIFAGWAIASACDIIFAADDAMFLPANFQYFSVPWDLGSRKAKEVLFESRFLSAQEVLDLGFVNRVIPRANLDAEVMAYAGRVAENDPFQLWMTKKAINQAEDAQGFTTHIHDAFNLHMMSSIGEGDPDYALRKPEGQRRRPMVQRAMENYEHYRQSGQAQQQ
ncbi:MAG: enoyl-CoA hydratase [Dehalococcoidia bacterium]|nr:MAG: enoyl-CoA hydratase [Dehalococcoidia bacterium]